MKYKVKWIEEHLGITRNMIRRYEKKGVILKNEEGKDREFDEEGLRQLWNIKVLVSLGFSLDEVKEIMNEGNLKELRTVFIGAHEEPNGVNSYTYNLALELKKRGFESFVMSFGSCNKVTDYKGVKIKQYRTWGNTMTSIPVLYLKSLPYFINHIN